MVYNQLLDKKYLIFGTKILDNSLVKLYIWHNSKGDNTRIIKYT